MCYHTSSTGTANKLKEKFKLSVVDETKHSIFYHANGYDHPILPVIANDEELAIHHFRWGLIPSWVKNPEDGLKLSNQTLNAKSETIFDKASFRDSILNNRCVIPVTGFFEWKQEGKVKTPYYIYPATNEFFLLAGIYSHWINQNNNELVTTFSIITTTANELMAEIHHVKKRMPVILEERNMNAWIANDLSKSSLIDLMQPCDDAGMAAYPVSKILSAKNMDSNIPEIIKPVEDHPAQAFLKAVSVR